MQRRTLLTSSVTLAVTAPRWGRAAETRILKVAPEQDLKILDPYWTTAVATANHSLMVYDTLFGVDEQNVPRPQMIDSHAVSEDRLVYRFKLRDGLRFHDGSAVTSRDVLASLRLWGARAAEGQMIMARLDHLDRADDQRFSIHLKRPFDLLVQSFAGAGISCARRKPKPIRSSRSRPSLVRGLFCLTPTAGCRAPARSIDAIPVTCRGPIRRWDFPAGNRRRSTSSKAASFRIRPPWSPP
jgi:hypothetical protein